MHHLWPSLFLIINRIIYYFAKYFPLYLSQIFNLLQIFPHQSFSWHLCALIYNDEEKEKSGESTYESHRQKILGEHDHRAHFLRIRSSASTVRSTFEGPVAITENDTSQLLHRIITVINPFRSRTHTNTHTLAQEKQTESRGNHKKGTLQQLVANLKSARL